MPYRFRTSLIASGTGSLLVAAVALFTGAGCTAELTGQDCLNCASGSDPSSSSGGTTTVHQQVACTTDAVLPGRLPLRRLNGLEWDNTIADLLGDKSKLASQFPPDEAGDGGFLNNGDKLRTDGLFVERNRDNAETLGVAAVAKMAELLPCDPNVDGEEPCITSFIRDFGGRAFRRPVEDAEVTRLLALFKAERAASGSFEEGFSLVVEAFINSPHFLYRVPGFGKEGQVANAVPLTGYEMASRLSYYLWETMPDKPLFDAAAADKLSDPVALEAQVRRMLADPRAKLMVADFNKTWLQLDRISATSKVSADWTPTLRNSLYAESTAFLEDTFWNQGKLSTLFLAPYSFLDATSAAFYGVPAPSGTGVTKVAFPANTPRMGLLTQGLFLSTHSYSDQTSPIHRGKFIREQFLCKVPDPPPPNVVITPPVVDPGASTRERFAQHSANKFCQSCHQLIDPIGLGFEHYDTLGHWRDKDGTFDIDDSGEVIAGGDLDGTFKGAVELTQKMADSEFVKQCVVKQWFRFAMSRTEDEGFDDCALGRIYDGFEAKDGDLRELVVQLALSDAFRFRVQE